MKIKYNIPINIADIFIDLASPLSSAELGIEEHLGHFLGLPEKPLSRLALCWEESESAPEPKGSVIYDPGIYWKMYREGSDFFAAFIHKRNGYHTEAKAVLRANLAWDNLTLTEKRSGSSWQSLLNFGAGDLMIRTAILFTGGLVFHSSGVIDNGKGIIFVGHSGAGKSTQVGLWSSEPGITIVNHDRMAVRVEDSILMCHGTPWGGTAGIARNHSAPLSALIILEHGTNNYIQEVTPIAAASMLSARAYLPYWDSSLMIMAMNNLDAILENVPVFRFYCRPEKNVIQVVRSVTC